MKYQNKFNIPPLLNVNLTVRKYCLKQVEMRQKFDQLSTSRLFDQLRKLSNIFFLDIASALEVAENWKYVYKVMEQSFRCLILVVPLLSLCFVLEKYNRMVLRFDISNSIIFLVNPITADPQNKF